MLRNLEAGATNNAEVFYTIDYSPNIKNINNK